MWNEDLKAQFQSLAPGRPDGELSRRDFVRTALGVGFAAAAGPVIAQTVVQTSADGLLAGEVRIESGGQKIPVYRAQPKGKTDLPVVLVVSEIFGVHEYIVAPAKPLRPA